MQEAQTAIAKTNRKSAPFKASKDKNYPNERIARKPLPVDEVPSLHIVPSQPPVLSPRILQAMKEDADAKESLSDIRGLLIGPVTRLHEARIEELLAIFEESDRGNREAVQDINSRIDNLDVASSKNQFDIAHTNENLKAVSAQKDSNLVNAVNDVNAALKDMFQKVEANIQLQSTAINDRLSELARRTADDQQAMMTYLNKRIDELEIATAENAERNIARLETQLGKHVADIKAERTLDLDSIIEGFADFTDRIMRLRARAE